MWRSWHEHRHMATPNLENDQVERKNSLKGILCMIHFFDSIWQHSNKLLGYQQREVQFFRSTDFLSSSKRITYFLRVSPKYAIKMYPRNAKTAGSCNSSRTRAPRPLNAHASRPTRIDIPATIMEIIRFAYTEAQERNNFAIPLDGRHLRVGFRR